MGSSEHQYPGACYSKDAFAAAGIESAPTTIDEFVEDACLLTDAATETYGFAEGGTYFWAPAPLFYAMGGQSYG
jgi:ABC-type glycerol-3-phosphate transport system substrate-binding protein